MSTIGLFVAVRAVRGAALDLGAEAGRVIAAGVIALAPYAVQRVRDGNSKISDTYAGVGLQWPGPGGWRGVFVEFDNFGIPVPSRVAGGHLIGFIFALAALHQTDSSLAGACFSYCVSFLFDAVSHAFHILLPCLSSGPPRTFGRLARQLDYFYSSSALVARERATSVVGVVVAATALVFLLVFLRLPFLLRAFVLTSQGAVTDLVVVFPLVVAIDALPPARLLLGWKSTVASMRQAVVGGAGDRGPLDCRGLRTVAARAEATNLHCCCGTDSGELQLHARIHLGEHSHAFVDCAAVKRVVFAAPVRFGRRVGGSTGSADRRFGDSRSAGFSSRRDVATAL